MNYNIWRFFIVDGWIDFYYSVVPANLYVMFRIVDCSIPMCCDNKGSLKMMDQVSNIITFYEKGDMEVRFTVMSSLCKVFLTVYPHLFVCTACICMMCFQLLYTLLLPQSLWWQVCKRSTVYNSVGQKQLFCNSASQLLACIWKRFSVSRGHAVAQGLKHCASNRKVAGSIPNGVIGIFNWHNPSGRTMALGLTQPLRPGTDLNILANRTA
jgi:hypothetical protein